LARAFDGKKFRLATSELFFFFFPKVECGYQVFLECETVDAEIFYTTDGSYPADCNTELLVSARWIVPSP